MKGKHSQNMYTQWHLVSTNYLANVRSLS